MGCAGPRKWQRMMSPGLSGCAEVWYSMSEICMASFQSITPLSPASLAEAIVVAS